MASEARTELDATPASASTARAFVRDLLAAWDCDTEEDVAVLLTTELVSNAVRHAATRLALDVRRGDDDVVRVEVRDGDVRLPELRRPDVDATGGRGLVLVDALARRWGAEADGHGKVVWFELGQRPYS
jgi:anti-sigma regulatory factor (Ser/Thr protein kinase)